MVRPSSLGLVNKYELLRNLSSNYNGYLARISLTIKCIRVRWLSRENSWGADKLLWTMLTKKKEVWFSIYKYSIAWVYFHGMKSLLVSVWTKIRRDYHVGVLQILGICRPGKKHRHFSLASVSVYDMCWTLGHSETRTCIEHFLVQ